MRWTPLAVVALFAIGSGSAAACDLAGPVAAPGQFFLFDVKTGAEVVVPVPGRWLGAGCELSNAFGFDGERFVWSEGPETSTAVQTLRLRQADGTVQTLDTHGGRHGAIGVTSTHVYYLTGGHDMPQLRKHRLDDHDDTSVQAAIPWHAMVNGAHVAWMTPDGRRLNVYDAQEARWLVRDQSLAQLGIRDDDQGQLFSFDDEFAFFSTYLSTQKPTTTFHHWTLEYATGEITAIEVKDPYAHAVDDGSLFLATFDVEHEGIRLHSMPAKGGALRDLGLLPHGLGSRFAVVGDQVVLASYANLGRHEHAPNPQASGWDSSQPSTQPAWNVPALPLVPLLGGVGIGMLARHWNQARRH